MKLVVENVAQIKKAEIEINGITLIAGENNTGKSTVGKVLYSLYNSFYNVHFYSNKERKEFIERIIRRYQRSNKDNKQNLRGTRDFINYIERVLTGKNQNLAKKILITIYMKFQRTLLVVKNTIKYMKFYFCLMMI